MVRCFVDSVLTFVELSVVGEKRTFPAPCFVGQSSVRTNPDFRSGATAWLAVISARCEGQQLGRREAEFLGAV